MRGALIEGVARAVAEDRMLDWNAMEESEKDSWRATAKAAIRVLKNPSGEMLKASERALYSERREPGQWFSQKDKHKIRYRAMIDVAMGEHGKWKERVKAPDHPENIINAETVDD